MSSWYFSKDGKQRLGPFTSDQLRQLAAGGLLEPTHMVLKAGKRKWVPAGFIPDLFPPTSQSPADQPHELIATAEVQPVAPGSPDPPGDAASETGEARRTRERTFWLALAIVGVLVLLPVPVVLLASLDKQTMMVVGGLLIVLLVGVVIAGRPTICPDCKRWWARVLVSRHPVEQKKCYGLVTRRAYTSSSGSVSGTSHHLGELDYQTLNGSTSSSGTTNWKERVPVIRTTYLLTYRCRYCHTCWERTEVKEVEDFDIDR
jgi:hypothetical protein